MRPSRAGPHFAKHVNVPHETFGGDAGECHKAFELEKPLTNRLETRSYTTRCSGQRERNAREKPTTWIHEQKSGSKAYAASQNFEGMRKQLSILHAAEFLQTEVGAKADACKGWKGKGCKKKQARTRATRFLQNMWQEWPLEERQDVTMKTLETSLRRKTPTRAWGSTAMGLEDVERVPQEGKQQIARLLNDVESRLHNTAAPVPKPAGG